MRKAIIDGATSFIGYSLAHRLINCGYKVFAVIRPNSSRRYMYDGFCRLSVESRIHVIECELGNIGSLKNYLADIMQCGPIDEYYHIGWNSDFLNSRYNLAGQLQNVDYSLDAMRVSFELGCKKFVVVGSQAECGNVDKPISSNTPDNPVTAYAYAKCETYRKCISLSKELGISFYWPRLLSAYGPYDRSSTLVMRCIDACRNKRVLPMTGAEQIWDYIYVDYVAEALYSVCQLGIPQKKYSIASGVGRPLKEYIKIISEVFEYPDLLKGIGERSYADKEVMYLVGDVSELYIDTGMSVGCDFETCIKKMRHMIMGMNWKE